MYFMQQKHTFTTMESAVLLLATNGWYVFSEVLLCLKIINYWWRNENLDKSVKKSCGCSFWCGAQLLRPFQCITTLWKRLRCPAPSNDFQISSGTHQIQCKYIITISFSCLFGHRMPSSKCKVVEYIKFAAKTIIYYIGFIHGLQWIVKYCSPWIAITAST